jgi:hypothetical protein
MALSEALATLVSRRITRKEDWVDLYAKPYYFGCEADDPMNATAFGRNNPFGATLNAIFGSGRPFRRD